MAVTKFISDEVAAAAEDPAIAAALTATRELSAAFDGQDVEAVAALLAEDLLVNTPANRVSRRDAVLGLFKAGRMSYESRDTTIEAVEARGDQVVVMGEQVIRPRDTAANAGKTVRRRFTDVWRKESDGKWRLTLRQATITSVE
jgi:ketosteroid isomerase-like protein